LLESPELAEHIKKGTQGQERLPLMACLRLEGEENLGTWPYREKI